MPLSPFSHFLPPPHGLKPNFEKESDECRRISYLKVLTGQQAGGWQTHLFIKYLEDAPYRQSSRLGNVIDSVNCCYSPGPSWTPRGTRKVKELPRVT